MTLLRYQLFLAIAAVLVSLWVAALKLHPNSVLVLFAPLWMICALGVYAVGTIAVGVWTFRDTPEASAEIEEQVKEAKREMKKRGIIKD